MSGSSDTGRSAVKRVWLKLAIWLINRSKKIQTTSTNTQSECVYLCVQTGWSWVWLAAEVLYWGESVCRCAVAHECFSPLHLHLRLKNGALPVWRQRGVPGPWINHRAMKEALTGRCAFRLRARPRGSVSSQERGVTRRAGTHRRNFANEGYFTDSPVPLYLTSNAIFPGHTPSRQQCGRCTVTVRLNMIETSESTDLTRGRWWSARHLVSTSSAKLKRHSTSTPRPPLRATVGFICVKLGMHSVLKDTVILGWITLQVIFWNK